MMNQLCRPLLLALFTSVSTTAYGQTMVLPAPPSYSKGTGACADVSISAVSDHWRIRKDGEAQIFVVQQFVKHADLKFAWTVENGEIFDGQGTARIRVKPGKKKAKGFLNASGFMSVRLQATKVAGATCSVESSTEIMIGRWGESRGNIYDLELSPAEVSVPCKSARDPNGELSSSVVDVKAIGGDAENDVLTYVYRVTGGRIVGTGLNVKWDLSGLAPGTYTIVAGADDGCGSCGMTVTRVLKINDCGRDPL